LNDTLDDNYSSVDIVIGIYEKKYPNKMMTNVTNEVLEEIIK